MMLSISFRGLSNYPVGAHTHTQSQIYNSHFCKFALLLLYYLLLKSFVSRSSFVFCVTSYELYSEWNKCADLTSLLRGPSLCPNVSGCSEWTAYTYGLRTTHWFYGVCVCNANVMLWNSSTVVSTHFYMWKFGQVSYLFVQFWSCVWGIFKKLGNPAHYRKKPHLLSSWSNPNALQHTPLDWCFPHKLSKQCLCLYSYSFSIELSVESNNMFNQIFPYYLSW